MNVPDPVDALQLMLALSVNALCANPEITKPPHPLGMLGGQWRLERIALAPDPYLEDTEDKPDPEALQEDDLAEEAPKKKKSGASRKKSGRRKKAD